MKFKLNLRYVTISLILCLLLIPTVPVPAQQIKERTVTGTITDENNEPMVGVSVLVLESSVATTTDISGKFLLKVPEDKNNLRVSFIGYETAVIPIPAGNSITFQMKSKVEELDEVVVIG